jgi:CBS domain-containing protein
MWRDEWQRQHQDVEVRQPRHERGDFQLGYQERFEGMPARQRPWAERTPERRRATSYAYGEAPQGRSGGLHDLRVHQVMTRNVISVHMNDLVTRAVDMMMQCDCGALPVLGHDGRLAGMVTDRDIAMRMIGHRRDPYASRVSECMTHEVFACNVNSPAVDCMREMSRHQVRRVPIVDDGGRLVGIVSQADFARHAGTAGAPGERRAVADVMCAVSEPTHVPHR